MKEVVILKLMTHTVKPTFVWPLFCQHISTHTGLKSNNVSSPPPKRKRRTLSDLATTAFAVKPKKIKKCSTPHYACLATNSSKLQSMAVGLGQRTSSHALVLLNGLLHTVLLICWNHANACFHGIDWATKAWEERLESRWRLLCKLVLHLLFGSLLHALLHATQQRCHCFKNKAGSVDCENADATKRLQPKQHDNMICHLSSAWISFCHPLSRNSKKLYTILNARVLYAIAIPLFMYVCDGLLAFQINNSICFNGKSKSTKSRRQDTN